MIDRAQAERIAAATHALRPDWPPASIITLIRKDLTAWTYQDLAVALTYVATEQAADGTWVSQTPARVKEQGPWRSVGHASGDVEAVREKARAELAERKREQRIRAMAITGCTMCDSHGRLVNGAVCLHDPRRIEAAKQGAAAARAQIRPFAGATQDTTKDTA